MPVNREHAFGGGVVYPTPKAASLAIAQAMTRNPIAAAKAVASHWLNPARSRVAAAWRNLARFCDYHPSVRIGPNAWCANYLGPGRQSEIALGAETILRGVLRIERGGRIRVGENVYLGDDVIVCSAAEVVIGDHTLLAHGVHVFDNDNHSLDWSVRRSQTEDYRAFSADMVDAPSAPVRIGADVWIGFNAFIGKGVTIGDRSIVAAMSVVTKDVPPDSLVAGNPAKVVRRLDT